MKQLLILSLLLFSLSLISHPPSAVELSFNSEDQLMTINVKHQVGNPQNHYIEEVVITEGNRQLLIHQISSQEGREGTELIYRLPDVKAGTVLKVTVKCNRVGSLTREITVE